MGLSSELCCDAGSFSCCCLNPQGVFNKRFEAIFPRSWNSALRGLSPGPPAAALPALLHSLPLLWAHQPPPCCESSWPGCLSLPLLLVWMNVSSLSPWLSDFHTARFSVSSGCFLFLTCPFGCTRSHSVYLRLHLGRKSACFFKKYHFPFFYSQVFQNITTINAV